MCAEHEEYQGVQLRQSPCCYFSRSSRSNLLGTVMSNPFFFRLKRVKYSNSRNNNLLTSIFIRLLSDSSLPAAQKCVDHRKPSTKREQKLHPAREAHTRIISFPEKVCKIFRPCSYNYLSGWCSQSHGSRNNHYNHKLVACCPLAVHR